MAEQGGALCIFLFALKLGLFYSDELMNKLTNLYQQLPSHPPWCFKSLPVERDKVAWSDLTTLQGQGWLDTIYQNSWSLCWYSINHNAIQPLR